MRVTGNLAAKEHTCQSFGRKKQRLLVAFWKASGESITVYLLLVGWLLVNPKVQSNFYSLNAVEKYNHSFKLLRPTSVICTE